MEPNASPPACSTFGGTPSGGRSRAATTTPWRVGTGWLWQAWQVADHHLGDPVRTFVAESGGELRNLLKLRNDSILAHGDRPVAKQDWDRVRKWAEGSFLPCSTLSRRKRVSSRHPRSFPRMRRVCCAHSLTPESRTQATACANFAPAGSWRREDGIQPDGVGGRYPSAARQCAPEVFV